MGSKAPDFKLTLWVFPEKHKCRAKEFIENDERSLSKMRDIVKQVRKSLWLFNHLSFLKPYKILKKDFEDALEKLRVLVLKKGEHEKFLLELTAVANLRERFVNKKLGVFDICFDERADSEFLNKDGKKSWIYFTVWAIQDPLFFFCYTRGIPVFGVDHPNGKNLSVEVRNKFIASEIKRRSEAYANEKGKTEITGVLVTGEAHTDKGLVKDVKNEMGKSVHVKICTPNKKKVQAELKRLREKERGKKKKLVRVTTRKVSRPKKRHPFLEDVFSG